MYTASAPEDTTSLSVSVKDRLAVPDDLGDGSPLHGAVAYVLAGWYVLPVRIGKHPGSYLGTGWPQKSTRDPAQVCRWWAKEPDLAIALHVGRSEAIAFDVDAPEHMPEVLRRELAAAPFQSTRRGEPERGHYLFALPPGVVLGNQLGDLRTDEPWGDVRGTNGIVLAAPSRHPKHGAGGQYRWVRTGVLPVLPQILGKALAGTISRPVKPFAPQTGRKRAEGILRKVLQAGEGQQNEMLFWAACRFGEQVASGRMAEESAYGALMQTGRAMPTYDQSRPWREADLAGTVRSGLRTGRWTGEAPTAIERNTLNALRAGRVPA